MGEELAPVLADIFTAVATNMPTWVQWVKDLEDEWVALLDVMQDTWDLLQDWNAMYNPFADSQFERDVKAGQAELARRSGTGDPFSPTGALAAPVPLPPEYVSSSTRYAGPPGATFMDGPSGVTIVLVNPDAGAIVDDLIDSWNVQGPVDYGQLVP